MFQELNIPIKHDSLLKAIKQLNTNTSSGPDVFLNEFFIHGKTTLSIYFTYLLNYSILAIFHIVGQCVVLFLYITNNYLVHWESFLLVY